MAGAAAFLAAVLYLPPLPSVFRFVPLHADDLGIALGAGMITLTLLVMVKRSPLQSHQ